MVLLHPGENLLQRQVLVVRHIKVLDFATLDVAFDAAGHVPQVPCRHRILWWTVRLDVLGEEVVSLLLGRELGCKLCNWDSDSLSLCIVGFHIECFKNPINNDKDGFLMSGQLIV